jgi:hypothetical protein
LTVIQQSLNIDRQPLGGTGDAVNEIGAISDALNVRGGTGVESLRYAILAGLGRYLIACSYGALAICVADCTADWAPKWDFSGAIRSLLTVPPLSDDLFLSKQSFE